MLNPAIQIFLENYKCEEVRPDYWEGKFTKTRTLHIVRDQLTESDWEDLKDFASLGFWELPKNLRVSAHRKFDEFEQWQVDYNLCHRSFPYILKHTYGTRHYKNAQRLVWGVLTSLIECGYWGLMEEEDV
tara:strand:+ start:1094 stop:1483 length:390 start_codon:yes stop_codon:yes gene_type:complete